MENPKQDYDLYQCPDCGVALLKRREPFRFGTVYCSKCDLAIVPLELHGVAWLVADVDIPKGSYIWVGKKEKLEGFGSGQCREMKIQPDLQRSGHFYVRVGDEIPINKSPED